MRGERRGVGDEDVRLVGERAADFAVGERPGRRGDDRAGAVVRLGPVAVRPPHRALDDDRHGGVQRSHDRRGGDVGEARLGCRRRWCAGSAPARPYWRTICVPPDRRYVTSTVVARRRGVGQQDEQVEERAGRAFGEEPAGLRRGDAGAVVAGGEDAAVDGHVHRALDQDRHAVGRDDRRRDVGASAASARWPAVRRSRSRCRC